MIMPPRLRKFMLLTHVASSVGWFGAVAGFLALSITALTTKDPHLLRAVNLSMQIIARAVIVPLAFASLLTGIIQSLGTSWGLFRHYWVLAKLALAVIGTIVLVQKLRLIDSVAASAAGAPIPGGGHGSPGMELTLHAAGGMVLLLAAAALSIYKPRGMTAFGLRKQRASISSTP